MESRELLEATTLDLAWLFLLLDEESFLLSRVNAWQCKKNFSCEDHHWLLLRTHALAQGWAFQSVIYHESLKVLDDLLR